MTLGWLVTKDFLRSLFRSLSESFIREIREIPGLPSVSWAQIERRLSFFELTLSHFLGDESLWDIYQSLLPEIFLLGSLIGEDDEDLLSVSSICLKIWSEFLTRSPEKLLVSVWPNLRTRLQFHVESVGSWSR